ncbi:AAA-domain-containing protein [Xylariomycetidae sp. FL2044]|nr:AAA-domain-containing protein [Xylariomycetidae sp. FL2044]
MAKADLYKTRIQPQDVANQKNPNHKNVAKVFIHPSTFLQAGFSTDCLCIIEAEGSMRLEAVAWPAPDKNVANNIVSISRVLQKTAGLELGQMVRVTPGSGVVPDAGTVIMRQTDPSSPLPETEQLRWKHHLEYRLETAEYILPGTPFEDVLLNGSKRSFVIESVNGNTRGVGKYIPGFTAVEFFDEAANRTVGKLELEFGLAGLQQQVNSLNDFFYDFDQDFEAYTEPTLSCGIVIQGSHGTGKSYLLDKIAATRWGRVIRIDDDEKPSAVQAHFKTALEQRSPTIILIDEITELTKKEGFTKAIGKGLDLLATKTKLKNKRPDVLVVATCVDYLNDIPYSLQRESRFEKYITLSIPDTLARKEILHSYRPNFGAENYEAYISDLGERTHAYTGGDLRRVLRVATQAWRRRVKIPSKDEPLTWEDIMHGLQEVRPSAMHDINLKPPTIRWSDIGGYESVKVAMQRVLQPPETIYKNMSEPTKGILLYGPPGCSKTMTAQAMATESSFNFFAVKGGELLNMYVGETERSIRNIFKRAREASPSIIFFDEIDSIAGSRSGGATSSGGGGAGGVQALTTLLNEMDGFEQAGDVFVLAATNKPEALDPALIRPGRFDELIYVPLPDLGAREAIIANKARKLGFPADVDVAELARQTEGYSGAEVAGIVGKAFAGVGDGEEGIGAMEVLLAAIRRRPRLITPAQLDHFANWQQRYRQIF